MPRAHKGEVTEHVAKDGRTYRTLRFYADGKRRRVPLGVVSEGDAERALRHAMADVERGTWVAPEPVRAASVPTVGEGVPTFHEFAREWWALRKDDLAPNTQADYKWRLEVHLIPYFGPLPLDAITFETIDRYRAGKRKGVVYDEGREVGHARPLSPRSINMTVTLLGAILERASKRKLIDGNPAKDSDLRVKESAPTRSYLDSAAQISALLDAAATLDRRAAKDRRHVERRAMLAVLVFAGLRISELCALRWRDVDLAGGWLHTGSKTDAGVRKVKVRPVLRDELLALRGRHQDAPQDAYVFATRSGGELSADNFRNRVLGKPGAVVDGKRTGAAGAVGCAAKQLEAAGLPPLPAKLTPHSLRRTFCSLLYALGEDPGVVMDEMGHTDPALALRVYRQAMRRGEDEKAQMRALVEGITIDPDALDVQLAAERIA
jgi:integrase